MSNTADFTVLKRRDLSLGEDSIMETDTHRNTLTSWSHKKNNKKVGKLPGHKHRQAHTQLHDPFLLPLQLWSCPKVYKPVTAIVFFFSTDSNENSELSKLTTSDLPRQKMWNVQWVTEEAGGRDTVLFSGLELLWLTGWPCWQDG